jgi:hypothetical protein
MYRKPLWIKVSAKWHILLYYNSMLLNVPRHVTDHDTVILPLTLTDIFHKRE